MSIREKALQEYQEDQKSRVAESNEHDSRILKTLLKEVLDIDAEPTSERIELDGIIFASPGSLDYGYVNVITPDGVPHPVRNWVDLGFIIDRLKSLEDDMTPPALSAE